MMSIFGLTPARAVLGGALLLASVAAVSAQTTVITREPVESRTVVTTRQPLELSPAQRTTVYRSINTQRRAPVTSGRASESTTVEYRVGSRVPDTVELYQVPETVTTEVPAIRSYKYMTVNNRVWLVDPQTSEVIAEVQE